MAVSTSASSTSSPPLHRLFGGTIVPPILGPGDVAPEPPDPAKMTAERFAETCRNLHLSVVVATKGRPCLVRPRHLGLHAAGNLRRRRHAGHPLPQGTAPLTPKKTPGEYPLFHSDPHPNRVKPPQPSRNSQNPRQHWRFIFQKTLHSYCSEFVILKIALKKRVPCPTLRHLHRDSRSLDFDRLSQTFDRPSPDLTPANRDFQS